MAADPAIGRADVASVQLVVHGLYERHGPRVLAYCRRRLRSPEEAEDALQTTFLHAHRGLQRGVVPEVEVAWLLKIARNVCLSHWDAERRRRRLELVQDPGLIAAVSPAAETTQREEAAALETALAGLTDLQRRAIVLREWRGLSYAEIAGELDVSQAAVETLLFRARRAAAKSLEQQDVGTRSRLARCLDFSGLFATLKSALGLGGSAKVAGTLALGAAVLAGSIPDLPRQEAGPAPRQAPLVVRQAAPALPAQADPVAVLHGRAAASERRDRPHGSKAERQHTGRKHPRRAQAPPLRQVTGGLGQTVQGLTQTVNGTVGHVTGTVLPQVVAPVEDLLDDVLGPGAGGGLLD
jgi:RNA polymerase sigma-70 factor (ECF subfamily)